MSTRSSRKRKDKRFICLGDYNPFRAERLLDAFRKAHVRFEIECDDGIRYEPRKFGNFGRLAKIRVWIDAADEDRAEKIQAHLFAD